MDPPSVLNSAQVFEVLKEGLPSYVSLFTTEPPLLPTSLPPPITTNTLSLSLWRALEVALLSLGDSCQRSALAYG